MTTLVVTSSWPRTRDEIAGTFVRTDALHRARSGAVVVAAPRGPGAARSGPGLEVIDVPCLGAFGTPGAAARITERPWRALGLWPFSRAIARIPCDAVVAHWLLPAGAIAATLGRPVEAIAHGGDVRLLEGLPRPVARRFLEWLAARARIRAVSQGIADRLAAIAPDAPSFVEPLPLATDVPAIEQGARAYGATLRRTFGDELHVVAARMIPEKRVERAIDAVDRGRLVLVGDGPSRAKILEQARRARVDVIAVGAVPHEQALGWIAAARRVVAPLARGEGSPTVIREARALGVPVTVLT